MTTPERLDQLISIPLPTLDRLGAQVPADLDAKQVAKDWFHAFASAAEAADTQRLASLFVVESFWRDLLALTWDFRTFIGLPKITQFLEDRLKFSQAKSFKLREDHFLSLFQPYPDLAFVSFFFDFETDAGIASGIIRLVPTSTGEWKGFSVFTNLEDLKGFPEQINGLRDDSPWHGKWEENRRREFELEGTQPKVLVIGGGQSGLCVAARLKALGVPSLIVEKNARIGDSWRNRYDALCVHDPIYFDHLPYMPFPATWPLFTPAKKVAQWLESYALALDLNVWTSSTVQSARKDKATGQWTISIQRADGSMKTLNVPHLVFATGAGSGKAELPSIPGMDAFRGQILHSTQHDKAKDHPGKKVVIVGAGSSAHDIAEDYYWHGVDVTMYQRSSTNIMTTKNIRKALIGPLYNENGPPTDIADRLFNAFPFSVGVRLAQRSVKVVAEMDKELLDGLRKVGFGLNDGMYGAGPIINVRSRLGGFHLDAGASQLIADGKIKLKSGSSIERITPTGLKFADGSELEADVILFATGLGSTGVANRQILGNEIAAQCKPVWGSTDEGEFGGVWAFSGIDKLWNAVGSFAMCRFNSKHLALQIKAMEEGVYTGTYTSGLLN